MTCNNTSRVTGECLCSQYGHSADIGSLPDSRTYWRKYGQRSCSIGAPVDRVHPSTTAWDGLDRAASLDQPKEALRVAGLADVYVEASPSGERYVFRASVASQGDQQHAFAEVHGAYPGCDRVPSHARHAYVE